MPLVGGPTLSISRDVSSDASADDFQESSVIHGKTNLFSNNQFVIELVSNVTKMKRTSLC